MAIRHANANIATIWKFQIPMDDEFTIEMPSSAEILFVSDQRNKGCIWARVVPTNDTEVRKFKLRGTGHPMDLECRHVGSFQTGPLVFHLFEATS